MLANHVWAIIEYLLYQNQTEFEENFFSICKLIQPFCNYLLENFDIIAVIEIGLYSSGNCVGVLPFGIGVTLAIVHDSEKVSEVKRTQNFS